MFNARIRPMMVYNLSVNLFIFTQFSGSCRLLEISVLFSYSSLVIRLKLWFNNMISCNCFASQHKRGEKCISSHLHRGQLSACTARVKASRKTSRSVRLNDEHTNFSE